MLFSGLSGMGPVAEVCIHMQVLGLTSNVRKMFKDMDEALYEECRLNYEAEEVGPFPCSAADLHQVNPLAHEVMH